jgi:hypothetical protein
LKRAVYQINDLIQSIHDYAGRDFTKTWKLRFPRGYVRTASQQRDRIVFVKDNALRDNIAYTLMLYDTLHWLLIRTDVSSTIKEQLIKTSMFVVGGLIESITKECLQGKCAKGYKARTGYLCDHGLIDKELKDDLDWIWDMRNRMHLFLLDKSEYVYKEYTIANYNRATNGLRNLVHKLNTHL